MSRGGRLKPAASLLAVLALVLGLALALARPAPAAVHCVDGSAEEAQVAGSDEGPPKFTPDFFHHRMTIDASIDGLDQNTLPISIETICGLPRSLDQQAAGLAGGDGITVITSRTSVWKDGERLAAARKLVELDSADTVKLRGRLLEQRSWKPDEDGDALPTFTASRIVITD
jgi:hypothetical protein